MKNDYLLPVIKESGLYRVDEEGRVWTRKKMGGQVPHEDKWRRAEVITGSRNRLQVRHNGKLVYASRLVWFWFFGPIPEGMEVDHVNNDVQYNHPSNLQLLSRKRNQQKAEKDGLLRNSRRPTARRKEAMQEFWRRPGQVEKMAEAARKGWEKRRKNSGN